MNRVHIVFDDNGDVLRYELEGDTEAARGIRAMPLAPTLDVYHALTRGEKVADNQLDPQGVKRLWKRPAA